MSYIPDSPEEHAAELAKCVARAREALANHDTIASLLADLMHFAELAPDECEEDFERSLERAYDNYESERASDDEEDEE